MLIASMILVPAIAALLGLLIPDRPRRVLLVLAACAHVAMLAAAWQSPPEPILGGWLALDALGLIFASIASGLFLMAALYAVGYLAREGHGSKTDLEEGTSFVNTREATFTACLLLFLSTMTLVTASRHFGLLWVAVEATTLVSAPLIHFHRHHRSLEATWKYLMICSVGIALALLGNFFLAVAANHRGQDISMLLEDLVRNGSRLDGPWVKAGFVLLLVGYGTKMGLAPLHTWLPDAHSESPSVVSALLSGALLNCAFLAILRAHAVCDAAGQAAFSQELLRGFGLISMAVAAVFILHQADYKRMLAYSSVEHMGILSLGVGLGSAAGFGAMLHAVNHSLTKAMLFLVAGNILAVYKTKTCSEITGVVRAMPISGVLWLAGFLAITGSPPFGTFISELTILKGALDQGHPVIAAAYLLLLGVVFVGMASVFLKMAQGRPRTDLSLPTKPDRLLSVLPPLILCAAVLTLGLYVPPELNARLHEAAALLGGRP